MMYMHYFMYIFSGVNIYFMNNIYTYKIYKKRTIVYFYYITKNTYL